MVTIGADLWLLAEILISKHFVYWRNNDEMKNCVQNRRKQKQKKRREELKAHSDVVNEWEMHMRGMLMRWASHLKCENYTKCWLTRKHDHIYIYIYLYCPLWSKRFVANNRKLHKNQVKHIIKIASALAGPHIFGLAPFCVLANSNIHICSLISVPVFTLTSQTHTLIRSAR